MAEFDPLIDKTETLLRLGGITYPVLWKMVRDGKFPPGRYVGARVFWRLSEIEAHIEAAPKQGATPTSPTIVKATAASPHTGRRKGGRNRRRASIPRREEELSIA